MLKLVELPIADIKIGTRARKELGDLASLRDSIARDGQLNPIIVNESYTLIAGERRLSACKELGHTTILARIMQGLTADDELIIEMIENTARKDFEWYEEIELKQKIHALWKAQYSTVRNEWGYRETAEKLGCSLGTLSTDITIAEALTVFPEFKELKNKAQAREAYKKIQAQAASAQALEKLSPKEQENLKLMLSGQAPKITIPQAKHADRVNSFEGPTRDGSENEPNGEAPDNEEPALPDHNYYVGSCLECVQDFPDNVLGYVELDPPYAIDFTKNYGKVRKIPKGKADDWSVDTFRESMRILLTEIYPKMLDKSWILCWTGKEHWMWLNELASEIGYHTQAPGVWIKPGGGSVNKPKVIMISSYETFILFRKGEATFNTASFSNVISQATVPSSTRGHQWEKPIELYDHFSDALSRPGSIFFSGFAGSGNSMISAAKYGMTPVGCDITQEYIPYFYTNMKKTFPGGV